MTTQLGLKPTEENLKRALPIFAQRERSLPPEAIRVTVDLFEASPLQTKEFLLKDLLLICYFSVNAKEVSASAAIQNFAVRVFKAALEAKCRISNDAWLTFMKCMDRSHSMEVVESWKDVKNTRTFTKIAEPLVEFVARAAFRIVRLQL